MAKRADAALSADAARTAGYRGRVARIGLVLGAMRAGDSPRRARADGHPAELPVDLGGQ